ncbi:hypothetical protein EYF80_049048 [Liparis tanakae]|uniref:Uncharacterized protein n=1 Tax=Liparis tanakae TaxID=230148 RepID=A0A4Z2FHZ4_9TELE|nr:hypothetical protein EYF80_049048 [Liparis tanakae]
MRRSSRHVKPSVSGSRTLMEFSSATFLLRSASSSVQSGRVSHFPNTTRSMSLRREGGVRGAALTPHLDHLDHLAIAPGTLRHERRPHLVGRYSPVLKLPNTWTCRPQTQTGRALASSTHILQSGCTEPQSADIRGHQRTRRRRQQLDESNGLNPSDSHQGRGQRPVNNHYSSMPPPVMRSALADLRPQPAVTGALVRTSALGHRSWMTPLILSTTSSLIFSSSGRGEIGPVNTTWEQQERCWQPEEVKPREDERLQLRPLARDERLQLRPLARDERLQLRPLARDERLQLRPLARDERLQLRPLARDERLQLRPLDRDERLHRLQLRPLARDERLHRLQLRPLARDERLQRLQRLQPEHGPASDSFTSIRGGAAPVAGGGGAAPVAGGGGAAPPMWVEEEQLLWLEEEQLLWLEEEQFLRCGWRRSSKPKQKLISSPEEETNRCNNNEIETV